jgi:hypothetical protein
VFEQDDDYNLDIENDRYQSKYINSDGGMDPKNNFGLNKLSPPASRKSARNVMSKKSS